MAAKSAGGPIEGGFVECLFKTWKLRFRINKAREECGQNIHIDSVISSISNSAVLIRISFPLQCWQVEKNEDLTKKAKLEAVFLFQSQSVFFKGF